MKETKTNDTRSAHNMIINQCGNPRFDATVCSTGHSSKTVKYALSYVVPSEFIATHVYQPSSACVTLSRRNCSGLSISVWSTDKYIIRIYIIII